MVSADYEGEHWGTLCAVVVGGEGAEGLVARGCGEGGEVLDVAEGLGVDVWVSWWVCVVDGWKGRKEDG